MNVETGELKTLVIRSIRQLNEASVSDIIEYISIETGRDYAYSTIATILSRLDEDKIVVSEKKRKENRRKTYFRLQASAHMEEVSAFLKDYIGKFGDVGIRHLGDVMGTDISKQELEQLREKIMKQG